MNSRPSARWIISLASALRIIVVATRLAVVPVLVAQASGAGAAQLAAQGSTAATEWKRMPVAPGGPVTMRPFPPRDGRDRCVSVQTLAGAQLFGDRAIELTMQGGQRYRLFLAQECPALSFYQGFYYRRQRAWQLCAGRDVVGARSGGECTIASIIKVRPVGGKPVKKRKVNRR